MSSIDERIVSMKVNDGQFQSGIKRTIDALANLKKGLKLEDSKKSLDSLSDAGRRFSLDGMANGVQAVSGKFLALATVGITALTNITNRAIDAGTRIAKSLTVEPIMDGFREYELKMGSIQTILANTARHGTGLSDVTKSLDELNTYADKTIYNFGDMTRNIGLFTNAGLKVDEATSMIKGFSNEAAASGTNSQGAAGAAYQLSQALSAGTIRLMDWRSLTNVGMGNKNMQNSLVEIADAMGVLNEKGTSATEIQSDFNGSLEKNWLSADVMSNYLKIMAGDMDEASQKALGLSDAQIEAFAKTQNTAEEAATKVRTWTQLIGTMQEAVGSSWASTFDILLGDFDQATELFTNVNDTLGPMITAAGEARNQLLSGWADLGGRDVAIEAISNAFDALMSVIKPIQEAFREIFPPTTADQLFNMTEAVRDFTASLKMGAEDSENLKSTFKGLFAILDIGWEIIKGLAGVLLGLFPAAQAGGGGILSITGNIGDFLVRVRDAIKSGDGLAKVFGFISKALQVPIDLLKGFGRLISSAFDGLSNLDFSGFAPLGVKLQATFEPVVTLGRMAADAFVKLGEALNNAYLEAKPIIDFIVGGFRELGEAIGESLSSMDPTAAVGVVTGGAFAGALLLVKKFIDKLMGWLESLKDEGPSFVDSIKGIFEGVTGSLEAMQQNLKAGTLLKIAGAIGILALALVALSMIDPARLSSALAGMTVLFIQLVGALTILDKFATGGGLVRLPMIATAMILLGIAVNILASAVRKLADLDWQELAKGLSGVAGLMVTMAGAAQLMRGAGPGMITSATGLVILAGAVKILASAVEDLSGLSWEELAKGLVGVGGLLASLAIFTKLAAVNKGAVAQGAGLILLGTALKILASAMQDFAAFNWDEIGRGMAVMGSILGMLAIFTNATKNVSGMLAMGTGLVILGAAMKIFASALGDFASFDWESIGRGLTAMAGALGIVAIAMNLMPKNMLVTATSLTIVAGALVILANAMLMMGGMSWEEIGAGLTVLAGSLVLIAGAMLLMTSALPGAMALIVVAGALALLAPVLLTFSMMSWAEIGTGLTMLAGVFVVLGLAGLVLTPVVPTLMGLGVAISLLGVAVLMAGVGVLAFSGALTAFAAAAAVGTVALATMITTMAGLIPTVLAELAKGIIAFAQIIATAGPQFTAAMTTVLMSILNAIATLAPKIVETLVNLVLMMLDTLASAVPQMVDAGLRMLNGILQGIASNIGGIVDSATDIIVNFMDGISRNLPRIIQSGVDLVISFVEGLAQGIRNNSARMGAAGGDLAVAMIDGMVNGVNAGIGRVVEAAKNIAGSVLDTVKGWLGIASPSKRLHEIGEWSSEGMAEGIDAKAGMVEKSSEGLGKSAIGGVKKGLSGLAAAVDGEMDLNPTIKPVMDLSDVKAGSKKLNAYMPKGKVIDTGSAYTNASSLVGRVGNVKRPDDETPRVTATTGAEQRQITFIQNNNSPKALSRIELYRQTKNQLSSAKGALTK